MSETGDSDEWTLVQNLAFITVEQTEITSQDLQRGVLNTDKTVGGERNYVITLAWTPLIIIKQWRADLSQEKVSV
jgi:hypothetical protein